MSDILIDLELNHLNSELKKVNKGKEIRLTIKSFLPEGYNKSDLLDATYYAYKVFVNNK